MKKAKRIFAFVSALTLMAMTAACDSTGGNTETTTPTTPAKELNEDDKAAIADIDVGEIENDNVGQVTWLATYDINPADGKPKMPALELFETKYGGSIKFIEVVWEERYTKMATLLSSGDAPDMYPAQEFDTFPVDVINGKSQAWDDYLDFNDAELWASVPGAKALSEVHTINGKHYAAVTDTAAKIMIYNKKTIEENGLDDPAELLAEDNWTWDTFRKMCADYCSREDDKFAYDWWEFEQQIIGTTGVVPVSMENGLLVNNLLSAEIERAQAFAYGLKRDDMPFPHGEYDWQVKPSRISEGTTLFYPTGMWALWLPPADLAVYGEMDEIAFVPYPRDPSADAYYLPAGMEGYALCKGAPNPEGAAAYMKCKLLCNAETRDLEEKQYREDYGWTEEMIDMMHTANKLTDAHPTMPIFFKGIDKDYASGLDDALKQVTYSSEGTDWASARDSVNMSIQTDIDEINKKLQEGGF